MIVFAKNDETSFDSIQDWIKSIYIHAREKIPVIIVGNKCDEPDVTITREMGQSQADKYKIDYFETSAKDPVNIQAVFDNLFEKSYNYKFGLDSQLIDGKQPQDEQPNIRLDRPLPQE